MPRWSQVNVASLDKTRIHQLTKSPDLEAFCPAPLDDMVTAKKTCSMAKKEMILSERRQALQVYFEQITPLHTTTSNQGKMLRKISSERS